MSYLSDMFIFECTVDLCRSSEVDGMSDDGLIPQMPAAGHFEFSDVWFTYPTRNDPV